MVELVRSDAVRAEGDLTYAQRRGMFVQALAMLTVEYASATPRLLPTQMEVKFTHRIGEFTGDKLHFLVINGTNEQT